MSRSQVGSSDPIVCGILGLNSSYIGTIFIRACLQFYSVVHVVMAGSFYMTPVAGIDLAIRLYLSPGKKVLTCCNIRLVSYNYRLGDMLSNSLKTMILDCLCRDRT